MKLLEENRELAGVLTALVAPLQSNFGKLGGRPYRTNRPRGMPIAWRTPAE